MSSALRIILGVSFLGALAVGCDGGSDGENGNTAGSLTATAGTNATGGTGSTGGTGGTGGTGVLGAGVPLIPTDGWIDGESNDLKVQGALFSFADETSGATLMEDFTGTKACINGKAAKVDPMCTPPAGMDCYGAVWGAAIGLNLNQPKVMMGDMEVGGDPIKFDASSLKGFSFTISGTKIPAPKDLRFKVDTGEPAAGGVEYCSPPAKGVKLGPNTYLFSDLVTQCWKTGGTNAEAAKSGIVKISWQVVTNAMAAIDFDFCVEDIRALPL